MPLAHRLRQMAVLSGREWTDLVYAAWELLRAHIVLSTRSRLRVGQEGRVGASGHARLTPSQARLLARVAWAIPRAAVVVPWRSDCLRQAEAARHWLLGQGVASEMRLGARKTAVGTPEMHAWLMVDERVVTGGDISGFSPFA